MKSPERQIILAGLAAYRDASISDRAALYAAAAKLLEPFDTAASLHADSLAAGLREMEKLQLTFEEVHQP